MLLSLLRIAEFVRSGWHKELFGSLDRSWVSLTAQKRTNYDITDQTMWGVAGKAARGSLP